MLYNVNLPEFLWQQQILRPVKKLNCFQHGKKYIFKSICTEFLKTLFYNYLYLKERRRRSFFLQSNHGRGADWARRSKIGCLDYSIYPRICRDTRMCFRFPRGGILLRWDESGDSDICQVTRLLYHSTNLKEKSISSR